MQNLTKSYIASSITTLHVSLQDHKYENNNMKKENNFHISCERENEDSSILEYPPLQKDIQFCPENHTAI